MQTELITVSVTLNPNKYSQLTYNDARLALSEYEQGVLILTDWGSTTTPVAYISKESRDKVEFMQMLFPMERGALGKPWQINLYFKTGAEWEDIDSNWVDGELTVLVPTVIQGQYWIALRTKE